MKQVIQSYKSGEIWLADVPVPACRSGGIIVQTRASCVSAGTERMLLEFAQKNIVAKAIDMPDQINKILRRMKSDGIIPTLKKVRAKLDQAIPMGYSCAGAVDEVGEKVRGFAKGDRVACGGTGYANHAEYNYAPKNLVVKIPGAVSFEDAACANVGSIALQGVRQCDLRLGENACVMGLGLLGLMAVQVLVASGIRVVGFDPMPDRCKLALDVGAKAAVSTGLKEACEEVSRGRGMDAVLITAATKSNEPIMAAGEVARIKGKVVVTGLVGMEIPRDMYYKKELDLRLSLSSGPGRYDSEYEERGHDYPYSYVRWTEQRNMEAFLDLVSENKITPSRLITHRYNIEDALKAYELLLGKVDEPYLGIIIEYGEKGQDIQVQRKIEIAEETRPSGKIEIGLIGAGNFTKGVLLPELKKLRTGNLRGLCSATGMNAEHLAKKEGFEYATTDYKEILADQDINAVFITTRHGSHAQFASEALQAGKHVFVEKPLVVRKEDLEQIKADAERSSACLMVGFNRRFSPHTTLVRDYFKNHRTPIFLVYRVNAGIISPNSWIQDMDEGGGRIIGECCHFIDFASHVIDSQPAEVQALSVDTSNVLHVGEDNVSMGIKYKDGSIASILYTAFGARSLQKERCEIFADESVAVLQDFVSTRCFGKRGSRKLKGKQDKGFTNEINTFLEAIENGAEPPMSLDSVFSTTEVTFRVLESLKSQKTIKL